MIKISNITSNTNQNHTLIVNGEEVFINLRFISIVQCWFLSVRYRSKSINGIKLSLGVRHIQSSNLPFDFILNDNSNEGIDPFKTDDFSSNRITIYVLEKEEI